MPARSSWDCIVSRDVLPWGSVTTGEGLRAIKLNLAQIACNQMGWVEATGYFHPGGSSIVDSTGEVTGVIPPRFVFEHLRPDLDVGTISREK